MSTKLYINGQPISKKNLIQIVSEKQLNTMIDDAKQMRIMNPFMPNDYFLGRIGMLTIDFK